MKKLNFGGALIAMIMLLLVNSMNAQSGWQKVLAKPYNNYFTDVWFVAGDDGLWKTGWVVEFHGDIYKTEDGGETWTMYTQDFSERLSTVCFVDENTGYMCTYNNVSQGDEGQILKSTDGGETWEQQISNINYWFSSIRFKDANNGVVSGTPNMYTSDGGETWQEASPSGDDYSYGYVDYSAGNTYFSTEIWSGNIGRSDDNGQTWENVYTEPDLLPNYISFLDGQHGSTGGSNERVLYTHDGGDSWEITQIDDGSGDVLCTGWFDADTMWAAGSDIYKSTDGGTNWTVDTVIGSGSHRDMFVTPSNVIYVINDIITDENSLWRKEGALPFYAAFESSDTLICKETSVDFTDFSQFDVQSWSWTFEGGNPSSSTDQNPTVTYDEAGFFDVTLTVTNSDGDSQSLTKTEYIKVYTTPEQAEMPTGDDSICTGFFYSYSTDEVEFAEYYEWEISPSDAGTITWELNEAQLEVTEDWEGDFTIEVKAGNFCGEGDWSESFEGTIFFTPEAYTLQGGGGYCEGGEGVEIYLEDSQEGITYELYLDGNPTGQIVDGTGQELTFGNQISAGTYTALAYDNSCSQLMYDQVEVIIFEMPNPVVSGFAMVCDYSEEIYEVAENAGSTYTWEVAGGSITQGQGTYAITVLWNGEGNGAVSVEEVTANECMGTSEVFEVVIDDCTGINEKVAAGLTIYPNPATDFVTISSHEKILDATLINSNGSIVFKQNIHGNKYEISTIGLSRGLYILRINTELGWAVKKILITQ